MAPKSTPFAPSNASTGSGMNEYPVFTVSFSLFVSFDDAVLSAPEADRMLKISPAAVNVNIFFISGRKGTKFSRLRKSLFTTTLPHTKGMHLFFRARQPVL